MKKCLAAIRIVAIAAIWLIICSQVVLSPRLQVLQGNSDFLDKYTAGQLLLDGRGKQLYDVEAQREVQGKVLASLHSNVFLTGGVLVFSHPPFVALSYLSVAFLTYVHAFLAWSIISLSCFSTGIAKLVRYYRLHTQPDFEFLVLGCLIYLPVAVTIWNGQNTSVGFLFLVLAFLDFKRAQEFKAGIWLSLALVKFQMLPVLLLVLLFKRRWQALLGFVSGGFVLLLISLVVVGPAGFWEYLELLSEMASWIDRYGVNPMGAHCVRGQMFLIFYRTLPSVIPFVTVLLDAVLVTCLVRCFKGKWDPQSELFDVKFSLLIIVGLLVAPHVNFHDLAFLLLPGLILFHHTARELAMNKMNRWMRPTLLIVGYPIQLLTFTGSPSFPIQNNVFGLLVLALVVARAIRREGVPAATRRVGGFSV